MLNFYQINKDNEIRTRDRLVIKALIPCQRIKSIKKFKFLNEILEYNLYYFLINISDFLKEKEHLYVILL
jgi:hypothetical protein